MTKKRNRIKHPDNILVALGCSWSGNGFGHARLSTVFATLILMTR
jgi:hypothetical protein